MTLFVYVLLSLLLDVIGWPSVIMPISVMFTFVCILKWLS